MPSKNIKKLPVVNLIKILVCSKSHQLNTRTWRVSLLKLKAYVFYHELVTGSVEWHLFLLHQVPFELTPNAQIWPRNLNTLIGGTADSIYLVIADLGSKSGSGLDFILGQCFLERFYSVYDTAHSKVGLAYTKHTFADTNWDNPSPAIPMTLIPDFPVMKWYIIYGTFTLINLYTLVFFPLFSFVALLVATDIRVFTIPRY